MASLDFLRLPGIASSDPTYQTAVRRLREMLYAEPDNAAPRKADRRLSASIRQTRDHGHYCPPGFEVTRAITDDKLLLFHTIKQLKHPFDGMHSDLPLDVVNAVRKVADLRHLTPAWREARLEMLTLIADSLMPLTDAILAHQKAHVAWAVGRPNVAFICACIDASAYPDFRFASRHCLSGFATIGISDFTGVYRIATRAELARQTADHIAVKDLLSSNKAWNAGLKRSLAAACAHAKEAGGSKWGELLAVYDQTRAELADGLIDGPYTSQHFDELYGYGRYRCMPRFPVFSKGRVRAVDDARRAGLNRAFLSAERQTLPRPDFSAQVGKEFARIAVEDKWAADWTFGSANDDEPSAYKSSPAAQPQVTLVALANPWTGEVELWVPRGVNFGLKGSGTIYGRKTSFLHAMHRRFLAGIGSAYVDDSRFPEPSFAVGRQTGSRVAPDGRRVEAVGGFRWPGSSQGAMWRLLEIFQLPQPKMSKHERWLTVSTSCGVQTDFTQMITGKVILLRAAEGARSNALELITAALAGEGQLCPYTAGTLRGKAQWALCQGTVGRACLRSITLRQYASKPPASARDAAEQERWPLSPELRSSLVFLQSLMAGDLPDIRMRLDPDAPPPCLILSDAMWRPSRSSAVGFGRVAFLAWIPLDTGGGKLAFAEADAPRDMLDFFASLRARGTYIHDLEQIALAAPYFAAELLPSLAGRSLVHFADNRAANGAAIKGASSSPSMARIVSALHFQWLRLRVQPWIEFVNSKANLADDPSRGDLDWAVALGAVRIPFTFPPFKGWE